MTRFQAISRTKLPMLAALPGFILSVVTTVPVSAGTVVPMTMDVNIGDHCLGINSSDTGEMVELVWKDAAGNLKVSKSFLDSGVTAYCANTARVEVGDTIKLKADSFTRVLVVASVTIKVNRVTNTLKGTAPANSLVRLRCSSDGPFPSFEPCVWRDAVRASTDGSWRHRPGFDILGDGTFHAFIKTADGDRISATGIAPFVTLTLGTPYFEGAFRPHERARLTLSSEFRVRAFTHDDGSPATGAIRGRFRRWNGSHYDVVPGDVLRSNLAPDANWIVPEVEAIADAPSDTVSGNCQDAGASAHVAQVRLFRSGTQRGWAIVDTDPDGSFSLDFPDVVFPDPSDVRSGDEILVSCMQAEGDWVQLWIVA